MSIDDVPEVFFELHSGLPREGPGDDESTLRALAMCSELPARPDILDVGCGPGMQTLALARATDGIITAVDAYEPYLDQLRERAVEAGVRERIQVMRADMTDLPFGQDSFDLIWSEGAAYNMGISQAFRAWRAFLRPRGYLVVSELTWLVADPPAEVREFWAHEYPDMRDIEGNIERIEAAGYELAGHFTLPDESWWTHYQTLLDAKLPALLERYAHDEAALRVLKETAEEHRIRRDYPETYGYEFYIARSSHPDAAQPEPEPEPEAEADDAEGPEPSADQPASPDTAPDEPPDEPPAPPRPPRPEYPPPLA